MGTEEAVGRYLGVFLPFIATVACGYLIVGQSGADRLVLMFRRALVATGVAVGLIVAVDLATDGDLFLRPRFPESQLLISIVLVGLVLAFTVARSVAPLARRFKRIA